VPGDVFVDDVTKAAVQRGFLRQGRFEGVEPAGSARMVPPSPFGSADAVSAMNAKARKFSR